MKIAVRIVARKAEPYPGGWSVEHGPDTFTYCGSDAFDSYAALGEYLASAAKRLAFDSRLANWPGLELAAEPVGSRKPNGWDANRTLRTFRVAIVGHPATA